VVNQSEYFILLIHDELQSYLIGADKTGDKQFYEKYIPITDRLYEEYLEEIIQEGLI